MLWQTWARKCQGGKERGEYRKRPLQYSIRTEDCGNQDSDYLITGKGGS
jgi:hypothetical protein